jgi:hypothetical protein
VRTKGRAWRGMLGPVRWPVAGNRAEPITARQGPRDEVRREDTTAIRFARAQAVIGAAIRDVGVALERGAARDAVGTTVPDATAACDVGGRCRGAALGWKSKSPRDNGREAFVASPTVATWTISGEACFNQAQELYTTGRDASRSRAPEFVQSGDIDRTAR